MIVAPKDTPKYVNAYDILRKSVERAVWMIGECRAGKDNGHFGIEHAHQLLNDGLMMSKAAIDERPEPPGKGAA